MAKNALSHSLTDIILLVVGAGLGYWGWQESRGLQSQLSTAVTGSHTYNVMLLYIGAAVCIAIGIFFTIRKYARTFELGITSVINFLCTGAFAGWIAAGVMRGRGCGTVGNIVIGIMNWRSLWNTGLSGMAAAFERYQIAMRWR